MEKKCFLFILYVVTFMFLGITFPSTGEAQQPVVIKAIMAWPENYTSNSTFRDWVAKVNETGKGKVQIKVIGGPEAIPLLEQIGALKRGVVDMVNTAAAYYMGTIPEAEAFGLSRLNPEEERARGFYDQMVAIHKEQGIMYLGRMQGVAPLGVFCTKKEVKGIKDLAGLRIRSVPIYDAFLKEIKVAPVTIPVPEIYTALERGVVDGFIQPLAGGFTNLGFHEVVKYIISHYFYQVPGTLLVNMEYWNKLPADARNFLTASMKENEKTVGKYFMGLHDAELQRAQKAGVKLVSFSPDDAKLFVETAYRAGWENLLKKSPKDGPKLREVSTK
jgi:TRAP-type C4-dicarboxylate transport system substrate-binding protein